MQNPLLYVIDDEPLTAQMIEDVLGTQYTVKSCTNPLLAVDQAATLQPSLILLDINMLELNGYEVCRRLKQDLNTMDIPVMFLSALTTLEDRMAAYDAGGEDFMGKPLDLGALQTRLQAMLRRHSERHQLAQQASFATTTAMTAMSNAAELGQVLQFARQIMLCQNKQGMAEELLATVVSFGLSGAVSLRGAGQVVEADQDGPLSEMERGVLELIASCGRIVRFGQRAAFNYGDVTLLIRNMPLDDEERLGRLRDHLASLTELAEARLETLSLQQLLQAREGTLSQVLASVQHSVGAMEQQRRDDRFAATSMLESMLGQLERQFIHLGLSDKQEEQLSNQLREASQHILSLYSGDFTALEELKLLLTCMPPLAIAE